MLYDVECLWPGWCEMGVKLQCGVECYGVILNVLWYGYTRFCIAGSEQFALSVLCCVLCNVSLVLFMCQ